MAWVTEKVQVVALGRACVTVSAHEDVAAVPVCKTEVVETVRKGECRCSAGGNAKACLPPCCACAKDMAPWSV